MLKQDIIIEKLDKVIELLGEIVKQGNRAKEKKENKVIDAEAIEEKTVEKEEIKRKATGGCKYASLDPLKVDTEEKAKIICSLLNKNKSSSAVKKIK